LNGIGKEHICLSLKPQNLKKRSGKHQKQINVLFKPMTSWWTKEEHCCQKNY